MKTEIIINVCAISTPILKLARETIEHLTSDE